MVERRRSRRVLPVEPLFTTFKFGRSARVVDLSVHGIQVEAPVGLRPASACSVSLSTRRGQLKLQTRVRRCRAVCRNSDGGLAYRAGLEFVGLEPEQVEAIEDVIVDLCLTEMITSDVIRLPGRVAAGG